MLAKRFRLVMLVGFVALLYSTPTRAQNTTKPFTLPFDTPPGPTTWLFEQPFGNTVGAFNYGKYWYAGGQNLHFGVDFWTPCNTPVRAIADGEVDQVDNMSFGLEPHNLTIFHRELHLTSIYGHLNAKPNLVKGQQVKRGDVIAVTGDPDKTCTSRPHLHLEVRNSNYSVSMNPIPLIDADWNALASIGYQGYGGFVKDLYNPNRWQTLFDQPDVTFNQNPLNDFGFSWPPPARVAPPPQTVNAFIAPPILQNGTATLRRLTTPGCCSEAWWAPDSRAVRFWNGPDGKLAGVMAVNVEGDPVVRLIANGPPRFYSPDMQWEINMNAGRVTLIRIGDGAQFPLATGGAWPAYSPGSKRLLWHRFPADDIPGGIPPLTEIWIANADGSGRTLIDTQHGGSVYWLDDNRILRVEPVGRSNNESKLSIYTISTRRTEKLADFKNLRGLSISPGGAILMFYLPFQDEPAASGVYGMVTQPGAEPIKLPFFGSWRWRDSNTVLYMPYLAGQWHGALAIYDVTTGETRRLTDPATQPLAVLNDDWSISPDGQQVVFWNAADSALWAIALPKG